eukprot:scaffold121595_cov29-Tisochrysis_lutea.AAC.2
MEHALAPSATPVDSELEISERHRVLRHSVQHRTQFESQSQCALVSGRSRPLDIVRLARHPHWPPPRGAPPEVIEPPPPSQRQRQRPPPPPPHSDAAFPRQLPPPKLPSADPRINVLHTGEGSEHAPHLCDCRPARSHRDTPAAWVLAHGCHHSGIGASWRVDKHPLGATKKGLPFCKESARLGRQRGFIVPAQRRSCGMNALCAVGTALPAALTSTCHIPVDCLVCHHGGAILRLQRCTAKRRLPPELEERSGKMPALAKSNQPHWRGRCRDVRRRPKHTAAERFHASRVEHGCMQHVVAAVGIAKRYQGTVIVIMCAHRLLSILGCTFLRIAQLLGSHSKIFLVCYGRSLFTMLICTSLPGALPALSR